MRGGRCGKLHGRRRNCCSHCTSHQSDSQIFIENRHFAYPACIRRRRLEGPRHNIAITFGIGMEKLEWCGYLMVKKF